MKQTPLVRRTPAKATMVRCPVCGDEHELGWPSRRHKTCGKLACIGEMKSRSKRGDKNPMRRPEVARRAHKTRQDRERALEVGLAPVILVCMRPGCGGELKGEAAYYCSAACHYADRKRLGMRREQAYHRCCVCGLVFPFNGNGGGMCCSIACAGRLGARRGVVQVVAVVTQRGYRRSEFRDEVDFCRVPGCGGRAIHQHHVVYRRHVEREHGDRWHPDNALGLCVVHHGDAHGTRRLPVGVLRDANFAFSVALLGADRAYEYLRRRYTGDDARLSALLDAEALAA